MKRTKIVILVLLVAVFLAGMVRLLMLRFESGDVYPPYSSLRADPLGTKALAESLGRVKGMTVERNYQSRLKGEKAAVFILGLPAGTLDNTTDADRRELQGIVDAGGRVIISLRPFTVEELRVREHQLFRNRPTTMPEPLTKPSDDLKSAWEFEILEGSSLPKEATLARTDTDLPRTVSWHNNVSFKPQPQIPGRPKLSAWRVLYTTGGNTSAIQDFSPGDAATTDGDPVIMERKVGNGSVVLLADSYLLSNEAMRIERHPTLLAALVGPYDRVIFDEYHLGVGEDPNLATLGREHGLGWMLACLALLGGLFMWKSMSPLLPHDSESEQRPDVAGRPAIEGLINLLRRCVPSGRILRTCFEEWQKNPAGGTNLEKRLPMVMQVMKDVDEFEDKQRDIVGSYNEIVHVVSEKRR